MSAEQNQINPNWDKLEEEESQGPSLKEVFANTIKHWQWLLLSVVICTSIGVLFILKTPNTYTENAQIVIKNDSEGGSSSVTSNLSEIGLFKNNANVQNEIATMSSPDVMYEVVKMLNLDKEYYSPKFLKKNTLYGKSLPINVELPDCGDENAVSFRVEMNGNGTLILSKIRKFDNESGKWIKYGDQVKGKLQTPISTPIGTVIVTPTENYKPGENILVDLTKKKVSDAVEYFTNKVKITLADDESTVLNIKITDQNIERADNVLAAIISVYNENWIKEKNQVAVSTSSFINDRLGVIENELGHVDSDISSYKSANLVPDVQTMTESYLKESQEISQQLLEFEGQLQAARNLRTRMTTAGNKGNALPANTTIENPALQAQIKEYNELLLKRNSLESKASDKNPLVQSLDDQIDQMRGAILGSVDNAIQGLEGQIRGLQSARGMTTSRIASSPTQAKYLLSVERQQKVKENLYLFLLQKREDNELNQAFTAYNTRVIKKPGGTGRPTAPKKGVILLGSFFLGLIIPFAVNFVNLRLDTKVRSREDLDGISVPMLGELPTDKKQEKNKSPEIIIKSGSRSIMNEAFRVLRTNIEFTRVNKDGCNVVSFTSFNPGSGKSFISVNLGASMALKGKKVLVIDGDLRRGSSSQYIGSPKKGLADFLAGHCKQIEDLIHRSSDIENLYFLPVGSNPPNPTELLESQQFSQLITKMRENYDYIIIDCPPIEVVADAQIIDLISDRTIFVLRAGLMEKSLLKQLEKFYKEKKFKHMAFILNGTSFNKIGYGNYAYGD